MQTDITVDQDEKRLPARFPLEVREAAGRALWARLLSEPAEPEPDPEESQADPETDAPEMAAAARARAKASGEAA